MLCLLLLLLFILAYLVAHKDVKGAVEEGDADGEIDAAQDGKHDVQCIEEMARQKVAVGDDREQALACFCKRALCCIV